MSYGYMITYPIRFYDCAGSNALLRGLVPKMRKHTEEDSLWILGNKKAAVVHRAVCFVLGDYNTAAAMRKSVQAAGFDILDPSDAFRSGAAEGTETHDLDGAVSLQSDLMIRGFQIP